MNEPAVKQQIFTARDIIREHLAACESAPTRRELITALNGKVADHVIDNFLFDRRQAGEVIVTNEQGNANRYSLNPVFVDPDAGQRATLLERRDAIVAFMQRDYNPISIDVILAACAQGVDDEKLVRALVKGMARAKMLLSSLHDGTPCYARAPAFRAITEWSPYTPPRAMRAEPVSPPAPKERAASQAPTGPAPVASESPTPSPPPDAAVPSATAAASETSDLAHARDEMRKVAHAIATFVPSANSICNTADDFAKAMRSMAMTAVSLEVPNSLLREIFASALQAQRTALLLRTQEALWSYFYPKGDDE